jgi:hypothetical protein
MSGRRVINLDDPIHSNPAATTIPYTPGTPSSAIKEYGSPPSSGLSRRQVGPAQRALDFETSTAEDTSGVERGPRPLPAQFFAALVGVAGVVGLLVFLGAGAHFLLSAMLVALAGSLYAGGRSLLARPRFLAVLLLTWLVVLVAIAGDSVAALLGFGDNRALANL